MAICFFSEKAKWTCGSDPVEWFRDPDLSECVSNWVDTLSMMVGHKSILTDLSQCALN